MNTPRPHPLPRRLPAPYDARRCLGYDLLCGVLLAAAVVVYAALLFGVGGAL